MPRPDRREEVRILLEAGGGVVRLKDAGELQGAVRWLVRCGELVPVLRGIFAPADIAAEPLTKAIAATRYQPDAVLTGYSAAAWTRWPTVRQTELTAAVPHYVRDQPGFRFARRRIEPRWVKQIGPIAVTDAFLTAVELIPERGGDFIDDLLRRHPRSGEWALRKLWRAFAAHPSRPGNPQRRLLLAESRDLPWSEAERVAHRLLREAGITGWRTNHPIRIDGAHYFLDIAFPELLLAIEINGFEQHGKREVFEADHRRRNELHLAGWLVLEFTWRMITEEPERFVELVVQALTER